MAHPGSQIGGAIALQRKPIDARLIAGNFASGYKAGEGRRQAKKKDLYDKLDFDLTDFWGDTPYYSNYVSNAQGAVKDWINKTLDIEKTQGVEQARQYASQTKATTLMPTLARWKQNAIETKAHEDAPGKGMQAGNLDELLRLANDANAPWSEFQKINNPLRGVIVSPDGTVRTQQWQTPEWGKIVGGFEGEDKVTMFDIKGNQLPSHQRNINVGGKQQVVVEQQFDPTQEAFAGATTAALNDPAVAKFMLLGGAEDAINKGYDVLNADATTRDKNVVAYLQDQQIMPRLRRMKTSNYHEMSSAGSGKEDKTPYITPVMDTLGVSILQYEPDEQGGLKYDKHGDPIPYEIKDRQVAKVKKVSGLTYALPKQMKIQAEPAFYFDLDTGRRVPVQGSRDFEISSVRKLPYTTVKIEGGKTAVQLIEDDELSRYKNVKYAWFAVGKELRTGLKNGEEINKVRAIPYTDAVRKLIEKHKGNPEGVVFEGEAARNIITPPKRKSGQSKKQSKDDDPLGIF